MAKNAMTCVLCFLRFLLFEDETNNMHPNFAKADGLSGEVIGAAIEVHRIMGPGLLESIYERCLLRELELRGVPVLNQEEVVIDYKGTMFKEKLTESQGLSCPVQTSLEQKETKATKSESQG